MRKEEKLSPDFLQPTEDEIERTRQMAIDKYGVKLAFKDVVRLVSLIKELNWWLNLKNDSVSITRIKNELLVECEEIYQKKYNKEITKSEAIKSAETLLASVTEKEKQRIGDEMSAILKPKTKN